MGSLPNRRDRIKALRKGIHEAIDRLAEAVDDVRASETFRGYLDAAPTDDAELPTVEFPALDGAADDLLADLIRVAESRGIKVTFEPLDVGYYGFSEKGWIGIANAYATGQQAKTLAHELAHQALHWTDRGTFTRSAAELEAEAVAYVVCRHFGFDYKVRSSTYIAIWKGDGKAMRENMVPIAMTAREIINDAGAVRDRKAVA